MRWECEPLTGWSVGLQGRNDSRLGDLVGATVLHVHWRQQKHIALLGNARSDSFHDLAINGLLVVRYKVLVQELLDLVRGQPSQTN